MASKQCSNEWENVEFDEDEGVVSYLTSITTVTWALKIYSDFQEYSFYAS